MIVSHKIYTEVAIVGGGILGLWLLRLLHNAGVQAILIEKNALGSAQSIASQGMIHGGQRYNLLGKISKEAKLISTVRDYWLNCFKGTGEVDLRKTKLLSENQYLINTEGKLSQFSMSLAKMWMRNRMKEIGQSQLPDWLKEYPYSFYQLDEPVVQVDSLIQDLIYHLDKNIIEAEVESIQLSGDDKKNKKINHLICNLKDKKFQVKAAYYCFTSGEGNGKHLEKMALNPSEYMQLRPLRQFIIYNAPYHFYGHFLGLDGIDARPSLTISTHPTNGTENCWYIGGKIATDSLDLTEQQSKELLIKQLNFCFKRDDFNGYEIEILDINRAESKTKDFLLPNKIEPLKIFKNTTMIWPAKLTLCPLIAAQMVKHILDQAKLKKNKSEGVKKEKELNKFLDQYSGIEVANYPWSK